MRIILGCLFALALMAPAPALSQALASRYQVPAVRDDGWKTANADAVGVDSTKLAVNRKSVFSHALRTLF